MPAAPLLEGLRQVARGAPLAGPQEPFGILPLEAICDGIQRNIEELVASEAAIASALDSSISDAKARQLQEEELRRMLEEQLPHSWGPKVRAPL